MSSKEIKIIYQLQTENVEQKKENKKLKEQLKALKAAKKMECGICKLKCKKAQVAYVTFQCAHNVHLSCFKTQPYLTACPLCKEQEKPIDLYNTSDYETQPIPEQIRHLMLSNPFRNNYEEPELTYPDYIGLGQCD